MVFVFSAMFRKTIILRMKNIGLYFLSCTSVVALLYFRASMLIIFTYVFYLPNFLSKLLEVRTNILVTLWLAQHRADPGRASESFC